MNYNSDVHKFTYTNLEVLAQWLKVLGEPKRLLIFNLLMEGVQCNCELGDILHMSPNLISHHLSKLREVGLVDVEQDPVDGRWLYYSVKRTAVEELKEVFSTFLDPNRINPRQPNCGPHKLLSISEGNETKS